MANEAILSTRLQDRLPECTVAAGVTIEKGTLLKLSDPNTGTASAADGDIPLGIASYEKDATDSSTKLSYWTQGIFNIKCDGTGVTVGDPLKIGGANLVSVADDATAAGLKEVLGYALQTGAASEVILVRLSL